MNSSQYFEEFQFNSGKLEAFFVELCEADNPYSNDVKKLSRELALVYLIALVDVYRNSIMIDLLRKNPQKINTTSEKMSFPDIVSKRNWDNLIDHLIEKELPSWTKNKKFEDWIDKLVESLGVPNTIDRKAMVTAAEAIATRNILMHKGVIDQGYMERSSEYYKRFNHSRPSIGSERNIDNVYFKRVLLAFRQILKSVDDIVNPHL